MSNPPERVIKPIVKTMADEIRRLRAKNEEQAARLATAETLLHRYQGDVESSNALDNDTTDFFRPEPDEKGGV